MKKFLSDLLIPILILMGCVNVIAANVPGGGTGTGANVTVKDNGGTVTLDNGIVSIVVNKTSATITSFNYKNLNLFEGGHGGGSFYWSWNMPNFGGPNGSYSLSVNPSATNGDYAEVKISSPWSGDAADAAMDVDIYYGLTRGAQGYYVASVLSHPATYPDNPGGEFRSNTYIGSIFDWLSVDDTRNKLMATPDDFANGVAVAGAPKEVVLLKTGIYAGQFECKYSYSADLADLDVWGWTSSSKHVGIWMTVPSHEYYNGGPKKRELTGHNGHTLLNMLNGEHYQMGNSFDMQKGTASNKTYGPYFVYANSYAGSAADPVATVAKALWQDAKLQAKAEQSAWPYTWFKNADYVQESGRGTVTGTLEIKDPYNNAASAAGTWIGLAPEDNGKDFQYQASTYQYWVKTGDDGSFTIPHVIAGSYNLYAFGPGAAGTFKQSNITVGAGKVQALGNVTWAADRVAPTAWEIGVPDRDSKEFLNGAFNYSLWSNYQNCLTEFSNGLNYTVDQSTPAKNWNYAQMNASTWTVNFNLGQAPPASSKASLYMALAANDGTHYNISVNGTQVASTSGGNKSDAVVRLGSHGAFWDYRINVPVNLLKKGANKIVFDQTAGATEWDYVRLEAEGNGLVTGLEDGNTFTESNLFPNPFTTTFNVRSNGIFDYVICDLSGVEVDRGTCNNNASLGIDLKAGLYIIKIKEQQETRIFKITKF